MPIRPRSRKSWRNWSRDGNAALVLLETGLSHAGGIWLNRLRNEGGRIVVTELPPLSAPHDYAPAVDDVVRAVLGPEALEAGRMENGTDTQVSQLEAALLHQAETLAREQRQNAESARARILEDAAERLKLAEDREVLAAKVEAERIVRRQVQAAETRMAAELDRLRWALTEATLAGVQLAFQESRRTIRRAMSSVLEAWLADAARALPAGDLVAEVRAADQPRLAANWAPIVERAAPGRKVELRAHGQPSEGGIRVLLANSRAQLDQTFEARQSRLADELARVAMERLFASAPDLGHPGHGYTRKHNG